ncbi:MAG: DUF1772 domain-containing protein [Saprospiraceae bacterium]|nr:DUF1772 domain-containing protein [Saprospiraceae bacterium]
MKKILPYITILAIGAFAGNMINIGLSYAIHWQSLDPIEFMETFKVDFPLLLGPTAATLLPAWLGSLYLFIMAPQKTESRKNWMYAFIGISITVLQTSVYHLPMNLDFMALKYDAATAAGKLQGWVIFHWIRVVVAIVAGVYALVGFQKSIH